MGKSKAEWWIDGALKNRQSVTADWHFTGQSLIEGVAVKEMRPVPASHGVLTEVFRRDWTPGLSEVDQVFGLALIPGALSAWHVHDQTTDRLFVMTGMVKLVLYDGRVHSPTHGRINEFVVSAARPGLYTVPPGIWHGVQNLWHETSILLNLPDHAYRYDDPDHWTLPSDSSAIPYQFA